MSKINRPLDGIRVLDFSTLLPGPLAGLILAEAGAEVIKIERPQGEDMRYFLPKWGQASVLFELLNRGKKSLAVDLKNEDHLAAVRKLIVEADVVLEQFRPGVMDRLGLGYEDCKAINPKIIYCAITGYGQNGPKANAAGHDLNYIGDTGLLALSYGDPAQPTLPPALIADIAGGSFPAVINILLALIQRDRTGEGSNIDIAMTDAMFTFTYWALAEGQTLDTWPEGGKSLLTGGTPRYHVYQTQDGRHVTAAPLEQRFWVNFCRLIELPEEFQNDLGNPEGTIKAVTNIIASKPAAHWAELFEGQDCCCSILASPEEGFKAPQFVERGLFEHKIRSTDGDEIAAAVVPVSPVFRGDSKVPVSAPMLGEDNEEFGL